MNIYVENVLGTISLGSLKRGGPEAVTLVEFPGFESCMACCTAFVLGLCPQLFDTAKLHVVWVFLSRPVQMVSLPGNAVEIDA